MNVRKIQSWLPLILSLVMCAGMWGGYQLQRHMGWRDQKTGGLTTAVEQALQLIKLKYVDSIALDTLESAGLGAIMDKLDPHSVFIPAAEMEDVEADLSGNFSGVGIEYQMISDTLVVINVIEKGPAAIAGVQAGDAILKVNDSTIAGKMIGDRTLRTLLRGKKGSQVTITLQRKGQLQQKTLTRGSIPLATVDAWYMIAPGVGYIRLNRFAETTFFEFMDAATALNEQGMKQLVLDLRGNGGGLLEEATKIADELLEDGLTIVTTRGDKIPAQTITATKPGLFEQGDIVVLTDAQTASASEVLAGALQDNDRAVIIGRRSFGKGLVQEQYRLSNGGAIRLTVARYYTPLGRGIQKPYTNGNAAYKMEILERVHNRHDSSGTADTLGKKVFTTRKGKKLYESGGITPDIQVAYDSVALSPALAALYAQNLMNKLVYQAFLQHHGTLENSRNPLAFDSSFRISDAAWQVLAASLSKDFPSLARTSAAERRQIEERMRALMARYRWRTTGYFQIVNAKDPFVQKALQYLRTDKANRS